MKSTFVATARVEIAAPAAAVWRALTDPGMIKQYMFGTEATTDWKVGSSITYKGVWKGKPFEDKGTVLDFVPNQLLKSTYWSGMSGLDDKPENYSTVAYSLSEKNGQTTISVTQDNNPTRESATHSEGNWKMVLEGLKALIEKR